MSDSVDRVFVKAISTIRALSSRSNYGSLPRPPAENRIKLYGLYKQATEGDVDGIMPRPVGFTPEDEGAKKKWDAWKREEGISKTEAKKRYISYLIETMRVYASGTLEARELLSELEYLWDQIKDLPSSDEEADHNIPLPSRSPTFSQTDRMSNRTPSLTGARGRDLSRIYSHSRRNTTLSLNEYVQQQRLQHQQQQQLQQQPHFHHETGSQPGGYPGAVGGSGAGAGGAAGANSVYSLPGRLGSASNNVIEDFKNWQSEVNVVINKLTREFVNSRREAMERQGSGEGHDDEEGLDEAEIRKRKIIRILKVIGWNALRILKNFAVTSITILFIVWCIKKNVVVERTLVKQPSPVGAGKQKKELVINMVLNTDENKWFIRLLNFINRFVGFV
ncbi:Autophagy-related protein 37 [Candida viswanathii]|uniref:Autophagy-related protein 37 n=1 Tax=Candida viswanathii TaxID=5486 RepID=A0A367YHE4_9ASCO|nr:Autophagy-related protein 37 [Candida viswanathii]